MNLKILHTSDWHLGQALWGRERIEEHQLFLDWLLGHLRQEAEQEKPYDLLLVAGDVFDSNNPPVRPGRSTTGSWPGSTTAAIAGTSSSSPGTTIPPYPWMPPGRSWRN